MHADHSSRRVAGPGIGLALVLLLAGCQAAYYGTLERFGIYKRDLLVDRVEEARDAQQEAKEGFRSALEQFTATVRVEGGDLQTKYDTLEDAYRSSQSRADQVHSRVAAVERVSEDLFAEWERELAEYSDGELRRASERQLRDTRARYRQLIGAMHRAEGRMEPVLTAMQDQVLFFKHNLNARAVAALQDELVVVETNVAELVRDMEASIREVDAFLASLRPS